MIRDQHSIKTSHVVILAACFMLTALFTGVVISHVVHATDSSAPAKKDTTPVGTIVSWAGETKSIPKNWLLCNGKLLDRGKFPDLFKAIGTSWGGSGNKFNLPDLRGRFLRGVDAGSNRDPDKNKRNASRQGGNKLGVGSVQESAMQNHSHKTSPHYHTQLAPTGYLTYYYTSGSNTLYVRTSWVYGNSTQVAKSNVEDVVRYRTNRPLEVGEENRPVNAAVHWIIKVK